MQNSTVSGKRLLEPARLPGIALGIVVALVAGLMSTAGAAPKPGGLDASFAASKNIWIDRDVLRSLPTSGRGWDDVASTATGSWERPDISDNSSDHDVETMAGALYAVRMNDTAMRSKVVQAVEGAVGTESGGTTLGLSRNLTGYVLAADLIGHRSARFVSWVSSVRSKNLSGRTLISTHEDRPNNWGTHAGAARIAADLYVGDRGDLDRATKVFHGFLGDRSAYAGFKFGDPDWQHDRSRPVPINPKGATVDGVNVDGALVDDIRRCECRVSNNLPKENYQWEAMQGVITQATLLARVGTGEEWRRSDAALRRAVTFLYDRADFPARGDDRFLTYLIDKGLGTSYSRGVEGQAGKSIGFTEWTHAAGVPSSQASSPPPTAPPTTAPPTTEPPADEPPADEPPANQPPADEPRSSEPPATDPPTTEPPASNPPAGEPPRSDESEQPSAAASGLAGAFGPTKDLWIRRDVLRSLPTTGRAWDDLAATAAGKWERPDIADSGSDGDVHVLAGALYAVRANDVAMRDRVVAAIEGAVGTESGGNALALGRNLTGYVLAADIVGHRSPRFEAWLREVRFADLDGRSLASAHAERPNSWGTHAGAARIATDLFLGDRADLDRATDVFHGFLGDRSAHAGFKFGSSKWHADPKAPVPINPAGSTVDGVSVDGVLTDAIRRCKCAPSTDPPHENEQWEVMQGLMTQATLLANAGHSDVWTRSDHAILRAVLFLNDRAGFPAEGDDRFLPFLIDSAFKTDYSAGTEARSGKSIGFTDWTNAR